MWQLVVQVSYQDRRKDLSDIVNSFLRTEMCHHSQKTKTNKILSVEHELLIDFNMPCEGIYYWKGMNGKYSLHESLQEASYNRGVIPIFQEQSFLLECTPCYNCERQITNESTNYLCQTFPICVILVNHHTTNS